MFYKLYIFGYFLLCLPTTTIRNWTLFAQYVEEGKAKAEEDQIEVYCSECQSPEVVVFFPMRFDDEKQDWLDDEEYDGPMPTVCKGCGSTNFITEDG